MKLYQKPVPQKNSLRNTFLALFLFTSYFLFPNDGSYTIVHHSDSGMAMPIDNNDITMVEERIDIVFDNLNYLLAGRGCGNMDPDNLYSSLMTTKCRFTFKNESDKKVNVLMGYPVVLPVEYKELGSTVQGPQQTSFITQLPEPDFIHFETRIKEEVIPYRFANHQSNPDVPEVEDYDGVFLFRVIFDPHETIVIENTIIEQINHFYKEPESPRYILTTGQTWKKPIEKAIVTVSFKGEPQELIWFKAKTYNPVRQKDGSYVYEFYNFRPTEDILFDFDLTINDERQLRTTFEKYYKLEDYDSIIRIYDFMYREKITKAVSGLTPEFLRRLLFDAGNYYYFRDDFIESEYAFISSALFSTPGIAYYTDQTPDKLNNISEQMRRYCTDYPLFTNRDDSKIYKKLLNSDQKGPAYYSLYNAACVLAKRNGSDYYLEESLNYLKAALDFGFPKEEYQKIIDDPDLTTLLALYCKELKNMLQMDTINCNKISSQGDNPVYHKVRVILTFILSLMIIVTVIVAIKKMKYSK